MRVEEKPKAFDLQLIMCAVCCVLPSLLLRPQTPGFGSSLGHPPSPPLLFHQLAWLGEQDRRRFPYSQLVHAFGTNPIIYVRPSDFPRRVPSLVSLFEQPNVLLERHARHVVLPGLSNQASPVVNARPDGSALDIVEDGSSTMGLVTVTCGTIFVLQGVTDLTVDGPPSVASRISFLRNSGVHASSEAMNYVSEVSMSHH